MSNGSMVSDYTHFHVVDAEFNVYKNNGIGYVFEFDTGNCTPITIDIFKDDYYAARYIITEHDKKLGFAIVDIQGLNVEIGYDKISKRSITDGVILTASLRYGDAYGKCTKKTAPFTFQSDK